MVDTLSNPQRALVVGTGENDFNYESLQAEFPNITKKSQSFIWRLWEWFDQYFDDISTANPTINGLDRSTADKEFVRNLELIEQLLRTMQ